MAGPDLKGLPQLFSTNGGGAPRVVAANSPTATQKPKPLDQVRHAIHLRHYSYKTEKAYVGWIKRFIFFHNKRHPAEMGEKEIAAFLRIVFNKAGGSRDRLPMRAVFVGRSTALFLMLTCREI
jgi:hypothetical protein